MSRVPDYIPLTFEEAIDRLWAEQRAVMIQRQRAYGPDNITRPKRPIQGILIRMNDKLARAETLEEKGQEGGNDALGESLEDTFVDLGNYPIIARMVRRGWWSKRYCPPLAEDAE